MRYRRLASPLHAARAAAGAAYCLMLVAAILATHHPIVLAALAVAVVGAARGARVGREVARAARLAVPLALAIALINPLVVREGLTVFAQLGNVPPFGQVDLTVEALVYGALDGVRVLLVVLSCALFSAAIDPDELLRLLRRVSFRSALTAVLAVRLVPVLARDARRLEEARRCRPDGGGGNGPAARLAVLRAVTSGALDRAGDVAATLEVRGYAAPAPATLRVPLAAAVEPPRPRFRGRDARPPRAHRRRAARGRCGAERLPAAAARRRTRRSTPGWAHRPGRAAPVRRSPGGRTVSVLSVEQLTYTYPGAPSPALRGVDLEVAHGEFVVLAGLSASGKSTLLRAACGLVPHTHGGRFAGRVRTGGLDTREHGPGAIASVAGTLFQDPETQCVLGTVRAELAFGLENRGASAAAVARGVEEAALALGVEGLLERPTHELSGGELQRVALGAALAGRPEVVFLDEPTSQLDPVAGDELVWLLRRLNEEWGTAIVLAEHRLERCLGAADRVVVLADGEVACDAPPRAFLTWAAEHAPALQTPGARLFARAGLTPPPAGVKEARATLRAHGLLGAAAVPGPTGEGTAQPLPAPNRKRLASSAGASGERRSILPGRRAPDTAALRFSDVWHERNGGRTVLRAVDLAVEPGERVALMGRNGAGKSTLLRHANGLLAPTRGRVTAAGRVALLLQNPGDYALHEQIGQEASAAALAAAGLGHLDPSRHPRDLSGGERQRLALAVVLGDLDGDPPAVVCLDEPTRGMDRGAKGDLADRLRALAGRGAAVIVATHDAEFAAAVCARVVLLADGRPIADGPASEVLTGGWYFATETARILGGEGGVLRPEEGAALLRGKLTLEPQP